MRNWIGDGWKVTAFLAGMWGGLRKVLREQGIL